VNAKPPIISNLKSKIWAHRPSKKGTNPLFIVIQAIIIITMVFRLQFRGVRAFRGGPAQSVSIGIDEVHTRMYMWMHVHTCQNMYTHILVWSMWIHMIHVNIHIYMYLHVCIHKYYIYVYICVYTHVIINIYMNIYTLLCTYICRYMYAYIYTLYLCICWYVHMWIYIYMNVYVYMYACTHICIDVCISIHVRQKNVYLYTCVKKI